MIWKAWRAQHDINLSPSFSEVLFYPRPVTEYERDRDRYREHILKEIRGGASWLLLGVDSVDQLMFYFHVIDREDVDCTRNSVRVGTSLYQLAKGVGTPSQSQQRFFCRQIAVVRVNPTQHSHDRFWRSRLTACAIEMGLYNRDRLIRLRNYAQAPRAFAQAPPPFGVLLQPGLRALWDRAVAPATESLLAGMDRIHDLQFQRTEALVSQALLSMSSKLGNAGKGFLRFILGDLRNIFKPPDHNKDHNF
jgi:hypothetical protein